MSVTDSHVLGIKIQRVFLFVFWGGGLYSVTTVHFPEACSHHSAAEVLQSCPTLCFSRVWLFATLWTVACQAPLSIGFSRQDYWRGLPCPPPGDPPDPGRMYASWQCPSPFTNAPLEKEGEIACFHPLVPQHIFSDFSQVSAAWVLVLLTLSSTQDTCSTASSQM